METRVYAAYDDGLRIVDPETGTVSHRLADRAVECLSVVSGGTESGGTGGDGECIDGDGSGETGVGGDERGDESRGDGSKRDRSAGARVLAGTFDAGAVPLDRRRRVLRARRHRESRSGRVRIRGRSPRSRRARTTPRSSGSERNPRGCIGRRTAARPSSESGADRGPLRVRVVVPASTRHPPRPVDRAVSGRPGAVVRGRGGGALVVTPDGGETWVDRPEGSRRDNHALATHPDAPNLVYAAAGDGFAESGDRGDSWRVVDRGLDHGYVWGLAVDPGDPETALVSAASGAGAAHSRRGEAYLYRRSVGGDSRRDDRGDDRENGRGDDRGDGGNGRSAASDSGPRFERLDDRGSRPARERTGRSLASGRADGTMWAVHNGGSTGPATPASRSSGFPRTCPPRPRGRSRSSRTRRTRRTKTKTNRRIESERTGAVRLRDYSRTAPTTR